MSRKEFYEPGTITLQYINDDCSCVGMVVGDEWAEKKLSKSDFSLFKAHFDSGSDHESYVCLILGWFPRFRKYGTIFGEKPKNFPSYIAATKRTATPTILEEEINFFRSLSEEKTSRGLNFGRLRNGIFSFNQFQTETIEIVATIDQYLAGCPLDKLPEWIGIWEGTVKNIYLELQEVIPISSEQKEIWEKENK